MMDLVYFGYVGSPNSLKYQEEFINEITVSFPDIVMENADDEIKGYRLSISLDDAKKREYFPWLIAKGWFKFSLTGALMLRDATEADSLNKYIELAKQQYPEAFAE